MTQERIVTRWSGWAMLVVELLVLPGLTAWVLLSSFSGETLESEWGLAAAIAMSVVWCFLMFGFFTLQPKHVGGASLVW